MPSRNKTTLNPYKVLQLNEEDEEEEQKRKNAETCIIKELQKENANT